MLKPEFIKSLEVLAALPGGEMVAGLAEVLESTEPSVGVRVNRAKGVNVPEDVRRVAWCDEGFYIDGERPKFTFDPAMHQGLYYVQDPSSMAIAQIVQGLTADGRAVFYIDMCAAPGGKTTAALSALPRGSFLLANEFDRRRAEALCENVTKWGCGNVAVSCGETSRLRALGETADIVAVDAPCSGEGMMRKESEAVNQWSPGLVASCATLQREILDNAWATLRPGGFLIYSTCTFNRSENEENLRYIIEELGGESLPLPLSAADGIAGLIDSPYCGARFLPGKIDGEGLFIALVRKPGDSSATVSPQVAPLVQKAAECSRAIEWLKPEAEFDVSKSDDRIVATPARWRNLIATLNKKLKIMQVGVEIATVKGRDLIPSQALALSTIIDMAAFPTAEIDYPTAIAYLQRQAITLCDAPRGLVLLTYGGQPLGFVKNLGNRANNLYPSSWLIRSPHIPESPVNILTAQS